MRKLMLGMFFLITASGCSGGEIEALSINKLPADFLNRLALNEGVDKKNIEIVSGGVFSWGQGYIIGAEVIGEPRSCYISIFSRGDLYIPYSYAPCRFDGAPNILYGQNLKKPDLLYKSIILSPQHDADVSNFVAFFFSEEKGMYCESKSLARWYEAGGSENVTRVFDDMECPE